MKKIIMFLIITITILSACNEKNTKDEVPTGDITNNDSSQDDAEVKTDEKKQSDSSNKIVEIKEKMFIAEINEIYLNKEEYIGKTIKLEGMFDEQHSQESDKTYYHIYRRGPGCCGNDGVAGFEVIWDKEYPKINDWVEAIGTLEEYEDEGYHYVRLRLKELNVKEERGKEFVSQ